MFNIKNKKRVLFVGIPDMAYICLEGLIKNGTNIVGVVGPKKNHPTYGSFKYFVEQFSLNFIEYDNLDSELFISKIKSLNADIAVVCSFNYKIPKIMLESVKDGFINVHPSLLPDYRGSNPYSAVILNNEEETGITLHFMDETFDTGDMILQKRIKMSELETMGTLFNRLNIMALDSLNEILKKYEQGTIHKIKQPDGVFKSGANLPEKDLFIDYNNSAEKIERLIRALNPFIVARTNFRGTLTRIMSADIIDNTLDDNYENGTIIKADGEKFYIKTSKGLLAPTSMQFGSFFAGTAKEFIKILNPKVGEKFL